MTPVRRGHSGKVDATQAAIVKALRKAGCSVVSLAGVGDGCPDVLVGCELYEDCPEPFRSNFLMEIKDGSKPPSQRKLSPAEKIFHDNWKGQVATVGSVAEALAVVGVEK